MTLRGFMQTILAATLLIACSAAHGPSADSKSNWLSVCTKAACGEGLTCVCGVCTTGCDGEDACTGESVDAMCVEAGKRGLPDQCSSGKPQSTLGVCLHACGESADCQARQTCIGGACIATTETAVATGRMEDAGALDRCASRPCFAGRTVPADATCYVLRNHGAQSLPDATKFSVDSGEHIEAFYYDVPWNEQVELVGYAVTAGSDIAAAARVYGGPTDKKDGAHDAALGTQLGPLNGHELLVQWQRGASQTVLPEDVAERLPSPGSQLTVEWHFLNDSAGPATDDSAVQLCVLPAGSRPHQAVAMLLGTEDLSRTSGIPAGTTRSYTGTCLLPGELNQDVPAYHISMLWPRMHSLGRRMLLEVVNAGHTRTVLDFNVDANLDRREGVIDADIDVAHDAVLTTTCTYENTTQQAVAYGPSLLFEQCYLLALVDPAPIKPTNAMSLIGAENACF